MLPILTVIVGSTAKAKGRRSNPERVLQLLAELTSQRINAQYGEGRPCGPRDVVVCLFMRPACAVYLHNAGDISLTLELDEDDLAGRSQEEVQDFTESLAETIKDAGPFVRHDMTMPIVHCQVRCGRNLGRVVLY
jgi:hypothetical protein